MKLFIFEQETLCTDCLDIACENAGENRQDLLEMGEIETLSSKQVKAESLECEGLPCQKKQDLEDDYTNDQEEEEDQEDQAIDADFKNFQEEIFGVETPEDVELLQGQEVKTETIELPEIEGIDTDPDLPLIGEDEEEQEEEKPLDPKTEKKNKKAELAKKVAAERQKFLEAKAQGKVFED